MRADTAVRSCRIGCTGIPVLSLALTGLWRLPVPVGHCWLARRLGLLQQRRAGKTRSYMYAPSTVRRRLAGGDARPAAVKDALCGGVAALATSPPAAAPATRPPLQHRPRIRRLSGATHPPSPQRHASALAGHCRRRRWEVPGAGRRPAGSVVGARGPAVLRGGRRAAAWHARLQCALLAAVTAGDDVAGVVLTASARPCADAHDAI